MLGPLVEIDRRCQSGAKQRPSANRGSAGARRRGASFNPEPTATVLQPLAAHWLRAKRSDTNESAKRRIAVAGDQPSGGQLAENVIDLRGHQLKQGAELVGE